MFEDATQPQDQELDAMTAATAAQMATRVNSSGSNSNNAPVEDRLEDSVPSGTTHELLLQNQLIHQVPNGGANDVDPGGWAAAASTDAVAMQLNLLHLSDGAQGMSFAGSGGSPGRRFPLDIFGDLSAAGEGGAVGAGTVLYNRTTAAPVYLGFGATGAFQLPQWTHVLRDLFQKMLRLFCGVAGDDRDAAVTEKHRRKQMKDKYNDLMALIPNPSKTDRASVVRDAIEYIQELQREKAELKLLIEKKRFGLAAKRPNIEGTDQLQATVDAPADGDAAAGSGLTPAADMESTTVRSTLEATAQLPAVTGAGADRDSSSQLYASALRSTWLQRRSRETSVDVRIVDDEANIKLTQKKKANCLLLASRALDELQLDVAHVSGGFIGEHFIFMFNTKIIEGSSVYASAIATKLLEVMDKTYPPPTYASGY